MIYVNVSPLNKCKNAFYNKYRNNLTENANNEESIILNNAKSIQNLWNLLNDNLSKVKKLI